MRASCSTAERVRVDLPIRGSGVGCSTPSGGRATAASIPSRRRRDSCPSLRRRRRARRYLPGITRSIQAMEDDQADSRSGSAPHRTPRPVRRAQAAVPGAQAGEGSRLPGVRRASDRDRLIDYQAFCGIGGNRRTTGPRSPRKTSGTSGNAIPICWWSTCGSRTSTRSRTSTARCSYRWAATGSAGWVGRSPRDRDALPPWSALT